MTLLRRRFQRAICVFDCSRSLSPYAARSLHVRLGGVRRHGRAGGGAADRDYLGPSRESPPRLSCADEFCTRRPREDTYKARRCKKERTPPPRLHHDTSTQESPRATLRSAARRNRKRSHTSTPNAYTDRRLSPTPPNSSRQARSLARAQLGALSGHKKGPQSCG